MPLKCLHMHQCNHFVKMCKVELYHESLGAIALYHLPYMTLVTTCIKNYVHIQNLYPKYVCCCAKINFEISLLNKLCAVLSRTGFLNLFHHIAPFSHLFKVIAHIYCSNDKQLN